MNKQREMTLNEIQIEEKKMLKELVNFLEKNEIKYAIWAGTYLGAVRHKGFIPWDDDVDLIMTRLEYNKLITCLKENGFNLNDHLYFIGYELGNSDFPIIKLINKNLKVEEPEKCDEYLWIDIFPLDGVPEKPTKYFKNIFRLNALFHLKRQQKMHQPLSSSNRFKKYAKNVLLTILRIWRYDSFFKFYHSYCTKYDYNKSQYVKNNVWSNSDVVYDKSKLTTKKYQFDDLMVDGFEDYDYFLSKGYGPDYMEMPPGNKRVNHTIVVKKVRGDDGD